MGTLSGFLLAVFGSFREDAFASEALPWLARPPVEVGGGAFCAAGLISEDDLTSGDAGCAWAGACACGVAALGALLLPPQPAALFKPSAIPPKSGQALRLFVFWPRSTFVT
jgi:hypothetical protein